MGLTVRIWIFDKSDMNEVNQSAASFIALNIIS